MPEILYGEISVFGSNGRLREIPEKGRRKSKISFYQRDKPNGVKAGSSRKFTDCQNAQAVQDSNKHSISYTLSRNEAVVVEYVHDENTDMFQIGRSTDEHIDFIVSEIHSKNSSNSLDKALANPLRAKNGQGQEINNNNLKHLASSRGAFFKKPFANYLNPFNNNNSSSDQPAKNGNSQSSKSCNNSKPGSENCQTQSNSESTVSRFACRIYVDRKPPYIARIYAAGFDSSKNIFLGERAIKWKKNLHMDGLTTNGIMILKPNSKLWPCEQKSFSSRKIYSVQEEKGKEGNTELESEQSLSSNANWREVSVCGSIYEVRKERCVPTPSNLCPDEDNILIDGTLIDLCGVTLLWRSYSGIQLSPDIDEICSMVKSLNMCRIQCPVQYQTLQIPKPLSQADLNNRKSSQDLPKDRRPYVYLNCGHVHGHHDWKAVGDGNNLLRTCPLCLQASLFVPLTMGQESSFHLNKSPATYCFDPCGHMASKETVMYWYSILLPNRNNFELHPKCPFCAVTIKREPVKLLFQSDIDEDAIFDMFSRERRSKLSDCVTLDEGVQCKNSKSIINTTTTQEEFIKCL